MLDDNLKAQLKAYLERLQRPVELVATLDDSATSNELRELLEDIRAQSDKITVVEKSDPGVRKPSFLITNPDGVIKTMEVHSNEIARDVKETLRKLKAAQYTAAHPGEVCPAKWNEGAKTIAPSLDLVGKI